MERSASLRVLHWPQRQQAALSTRRRAVAWAIVVLGLPALTVAGLAYRSSDSLTVVMLSYVLAVVGTAVLGGIAPAVTGAFTSFLLANFFLTEPYYTFQIGSRERIVELVLFVVVGVMVSVTVEVGARNRAVQAARASQLVEVDRTRSAILAAVSHDLRTPLSSIKVAASTLRQPDIRWTPEEQAELLATIEDGADRLDGVVTNLLAMTRIQAGALIVRNQPVVADEVVARALISLGGHAVHLRVDVPENLPTVVADPDLLERVVANLVANAVRFDPVDAEVGARATVATWRSRWWTMAPASRLTAGRRCSRPSAAWTTGKATLAAGSDSPSLADSATRWEPP